MAGDWIKIEKATPDKPEVLRIATILSIHPDQAFGLCFRFWSWCDSHLATGNAASVTTTMLDLLLRQQGIAEALITVGWLRVRAGSLEVPNYDRHLSDNAKKRALSCERTAKSRENSSKIMSQNGNAPSVTPALPEKRREEKRKVKPSTSSQIPSGSEPQSQALPNNDLGGGGGEKYLFVEEDRPVWESLQRRLEGFGMARAREALGDALRNGISPEKVTVLISVWQAGAFDGVFKWPVGLLYEKLRSLECHQDPAALVWPPPCETWQLAQRSSPKTDRTQEATIIIREGRKKHAPDPKIAEVLQQRGYGDLIGALLGSQFVPNSQESTV